MQTKTPTDLNMVVPKQISDSVGGEWIHADLEGAFAFVGVHKLYNTCCFDQWRDTKQR